MKWNHFSTTTDEEGRYIASTYGSMIELSIETKNRFQSLYGEEEKQITESTLFPPRLVEADTGMGDHHVVAHAATCSQ